MKNTLEKLENLENLMDKYDLYKKDDEVGLALAELRQSITSPVTPQLIFESEPQMELSKPVIITASFLELKRMGIDFDLENREGVLLQDYGDGWGQVRVNTGGVDVHWDIRNHGYKLKES